MATIISSTLSKPFRSNVKLNRWSSHSADDSLASLPLYALWIPSSWNLCDRRTRPLLRRSRIAEPCRSYTRLGSTVMDDGGRNIYEGQSVRCLPFPNESRLSRLSATQDPAKAHSLLPRLLRISIAPLLTIYALVTCGREYRDNAKSLTDLDVADDHTPPSPFIPTFIAHDGGRTSLFELQEIVDAGSLPRTVFTPTVHLQHLQRPPTLLPAGPRPILPGCFLAVSSASIDRSRQPSVSLSQYGLIDRWLHIGETWASSASVGRMAWGGLLAEEGHPSERLYPLIRLIIRVAIPLAVRLSSVIHAAPRIRFAIGKRRAQAMGVSSTLTCCRWSRRRCSGELRWEEYMHLDSTLHSLVLIAGGLEMGKSGSVRFFTLFARTSNPRFGSKSKISEPEPQGSVQFGRFRRFGPVFFGSNLDFGLPEPKVRFKNRYNPNLNPEPGFSSVRFGFEPII
ncbi:hypothetical protein C8F01DRAFT_1251294 [Mycena amicta]|nr:hypothetical protein C8F01DRAFT_1251294 [Mycena amicta]